MRAGDRDRERRKNGKSESEREPEVYKTIPRMLQNDTHEVLQVGGNKRMKSERIKRVCLVTSLPTEEETRLAQMINIENERVREEEETHFSS